MGSPTSEDSPHILLSEHSSARHALQFSEALPIRKHTSSWESVGNGHLVSLGLCFFPCLVACGLRSTSDWCCGTSDDSLPHVFTHSSIRCRPRRQRVQRAIRGSRFISRTRACSNRDSSRRLLWFFHSALVEEWRWIDLRSFRRSLRFPAARTRPSSGESRRTPVYLSVL